MQGKKKVTRVPAGSVIEYPMIGPVADTVRYCIHCRREFAPGEHWRLIGRTGRWLLRRQARRLPNRGNRRQLAA